MEARWILATLLVVASCSDFRPRAMADGSYRLQCSSTSAQCVNRARKWCGDDELVIAKQSDEEVFGVEGHKTGAKGALVIFRCGSGHEEPEWKLPPRGGASASANPAGSASVKPAGSASAKPAASAPPPPAPTRVCIPGATQGCLGPGACAGAQACLRDGSGYGPCDCGGGLPDAGVDAGDSSADAGAGR